MSRVIKAILKINPDAKVSIEEAQTSAKASNKIFDDEKQAREDLKSSAKAKLVAGEALTEDEANVMIGG